MTDLSDFDVKQYLTDRPELRTRIDAREAIELAGVGKIQDKAKDSPMLKVHAYESSKKGHPHQDFIDQIVELAHLNGWRIVYWRPAQVSRGGKTIYETPIGGDGKDFPDLFLVRPAYFRGKRTQNDELFWEVKIPPDKVRPGQQVWLDLLGGRVVSPADWDYIKEQLTEPATFEVV